MFAQEVQACGRRKTDNGQEFSRSSGIETFVREMEYRYGVLELHVELQYGVGD